MEELPPGFLSLGLGHAPVPTPTAAPPPGRAPPALMEEIVEEIILRIPPVDPASLVRAALVCRHWARLVADRGFRRRYRERHRAAPPLLGFLANLAHTGDSTRFVPTLAFRPAPAPAPAHRGDYRAHDARHGRVLLNRITWGGGGVALELGDGDALAVWDPVTDEHRPLPLLARPQELLSWNAAVLCAAHDADCDHLDCRPGHFLVAYVSVDATEVFAHVYSSEAAAWGEASSSNLPGDHLDDTVPGALARNALYFAFQTGDRMLKYDLATRKLSEISVPQRPYAQRFGIMAMEGGELGFAEVDSELTLKLWSMETGPDGDAGKWAIVRSMELSPLFPPPAFGGAVAAFADIVGVIFLHRSDGLYTFDLKTGKSIHVMADDFYDIIPYVSFYTPVLRVAATGEV